MLRWKGKPVKKIFTRASVFFLRALAILITVFAVAFTFYMVVKSGVS